MEKDRKIETKMFLIAKNTEYPSLPAIRKNHNNHLTFSSMCSIHAFLLLILTMQFDPVFATSSLLHFSTTSADDHANITTNVVDTITTTNKYATLNNGDIFLQEKEASEGKRTGIPGTRLTQDGYDNEHSKNPICWRSEGAQISKTQTNNISEDQGAIMNEEQMFEFPNELIADFQFTGKIKLLATCPSGITLNVTTPFSQMSDDYSKPFEPSTFEWYTYRIRGIIDLDQLEEPAAVAISDHGPRILLQILLCDLEVGGFCSPFVHEQANEREGKTKTNKTKVVGNLHGGSHVHSPSVLVDLSPSNTTHFDNQSITGQRKEDQQQPQNQRKIIFDELVPTLVNQRGKYFVIGTIQMFVKDSFGIIHRYDMANAAYDGRIWEYEDPPKILKVREKAAITIWVITSGLSLFVLFCAWQCWKHRKHQVLKLSQGSFLIVSLLAGVWAIMSLNLISPRNDTYCNWKFPMILVPLQLIKGITIGRLWRIEMVISPLLQDSCDYNNRLSSAFRYILTQIAQCGCVNRCFYSSGKQRRRRSSHSQRGKIRRTIPAYQVAIIAIVLTLPQVFLMVASAFLQPSIWREFLVPGTRIVKYQCEVPGSSLKHLCVYGIWYLVMTNAALLVVAQACRKLPSLFNEASTIHAATLITSILAVTVVCASVVATEPTTSPEVGFLLWVAFLATIILNSTVRMAWPKLAMIWRGETVIVSKLVSDHREARRKSSYDPRLKGVTGFSPNLERQSTYTTAESQEKPLSCRPPTPPTPVENKASLQEQLPSQQHQNQVETNDRGHSFPTSLLRQGSQGLQKQPERRISRDSSISIPDGVERASLINKSFVFRENEAPDHGIVVSMLRMQHQLSTINAKITSGRGVSEDEWKEIVTESRALHNVFQDIEFNDSYGGILHGATTV